VKRWRLERPDEKTGLGRLEQLTMDAIRAGLQAPADIWARVSAADTHPRYWGDTTLWAKINGLADRNPPLVKIVGPKERLPQWGGPAGLDLFRIFPVG
jgi:hypothetical protein